MACPKQLSCFTIILVICLLLCAALPEADSDVTTQETLDHLKLIEESVDHSVDPCDDFYAYACGNWKNNPLHLGNAMHSILEQNFDNAVYDMLEEMVETQTDIIKYNQTFVDKTLIYYKTCDNVYATQYFEKVKPGINLEWPLINERDAKEQQNFDNFNVFAFLGELFSYGFNNVLLNVNLERLDNGTIYIWLNASDHFEFKLNSVDDLLRDINFTLKENKLKHLKSEIKKTHDFWQQSLPTNDSEPTEIILTYDQVRTMYPKLLTFFENMLPNQIRNDDIIEIINLDYIEFLIEKRWQSSEAQTLCNYLMVEFFKYMDANTDNGLKSFVQLKMHLAVNFLFYQHYIQPHEKQYNSAFKTLSEKIRKHLMALVEENNLKFPDYLVQAIKNKLSKIHVSGGNLPDDVNFGMVNNFYRDVPDLSETNGGENLLHILKHRFLENINCPKHMMCVEDAMPGPHTFILQSLIIAPFASLSTPMYHWNFDPLFTVSLMGYSLGHEYTHSIDTTSLISEEIFAELSKDFKNHSTINRATQCMLNQKSTDYITERVSDFGGARAAYRLYGEEYNVQPAFSKTPWQQLFFLNIAQYFCRHLEASVDHDPGDVRVQQLVMNMNEFAQAFNCPVGSKMNPEKKCRFY